MSAQIAQYEEDRKQYQEQLDIVLISLKDDPENAELLGLKAELDDMINLINESIAELKPKSAPKPTTQKAAPPPPAAAPVQEKWSRENHPAFKKAAQEEKDREQRDKEAVAAAAAASAPVAYQVNDTVLAKWHSGDKGFYPGRITSVTGSTTDPIYTVKFKSYDTVETLRAKDIKPVSNKRKADGSGLANPSSASGGLHSPVGSSFGGGSSTAGPSTSSDGIVLTSAPSVYPQAEQAAAADGEKPVKKFKKIKATKELEKGKNKWQEFNNKSKFAKTQKKDSMFRTPDGPNGRVGFTGSGQAMRKDPTRSRHIYQPNEDVD